MFIVKILNIRFLIFLIVWIYSFNISSVFCQEKDSLKLLKESFDQKYGLNPYLYNGRKYVHQHPYAFGFPEWLRKDPFKGEIVLSGIKYTDLLLRFNAFEHFFILSYKDYNSATKSIILNNDQIDTVKINGSVFVQNKNENIPYDFVELIAQDSISCYIAWRKDFSYNGGAMQPGFYYTENIKQIYITYKDNCWLARNKRIFLKSLSKGIRNSVKKYLASQNRKFTKMNSQELEQLFNYCNELQH